MDDPQLPPVFTRAEALAAGMTRHQSAHRVRTGHWRQLRRATYCLQSAYDDADDRRRHELETIAALRAQGHDAVASHLSAAALLGWPNPLGGWGSATITVAPPGQRTRRRDRLVVQVASLPAGHTTQWRGQPCTSPARTAADLLRHLPPRESVAIVDQALRRRATTTEHIKRVLDYQANWPYLARAHTALALTDPRRESWLESWSFVGLFMCGLPLPEPQVDVFDRRGQWLARSDGMWVEDHTVAEADGQVKYDLRGLYIAGAAPEASAEALIDRGQARLDAQRRRHDALRSTGLEVVRWTASDAARGLNELARRVNERRAIGRRATFMGSVRLQPLPALGAG